MKTRLPSITVAKFGGTSIATPERWDVVHEVLRCHLEEGSRPILVLSAVAGITNELEAIVRALRTGSPALDRVEAIRRIHDELADGLRLQDRDGDVREWLVAGDDDRGHHPYFSATCEVAHNSILRDVVLRQPRTVTVTQGFIARNTRGETVLLGRGGSDTSASCLAALLGAATVEIWTDVPGVFTADPRRLDDAHLLSRLSYDEAETFAENGAKVLHARCLAPVREAGIPLSIHWTTRPEYPGTQVDDVGGRRGVKGVGLRENLWLLTVERTGSHRPAHLLAELLIGFDRVGLVPDLLVSGNDNLQVIFDPVSSPFVAAQLQELVNGLSAAAHVTVCNELAAVSLVGHELRACTDQLAPFLRALGETDFPMVAQAPSGNSLTFITHSADAHALQRMLHEILLGAGASVAIDGPSWSELTDPRIQSSRIETRSKLK